MVSRGRLGRAGFQLVLVMAGVLATVAWQHGLWATTGCMGAVAVLMIAAGATRRVPVRAAAPMVVDPVAGRGENALLRAMLDQAPTALLAVEEGTRVRALNRAARRRFGTNDLIVAPPAALLDPMAARWNHDGRSWRIDRAAMTGAGSPLMLLALVDVDAEEHAAEARATRELLRILGHEVMNALAPITSLAESALAVLPDAARRDRLLPGILDTLSHRADGLRRFTAAYRLIARLPPPALAPVRPDHLLQELARLFAAQWAGRVALRVGGEGLPRIALDRGQVVQALWALLQNGAEAALAGHDRPQVRLTAIADPGQVRFLVSDNGCGVDAAHAASMFDPFVTTKAEGNGIGLTAARQIAQSHGGNVLHRAGCEDTTFELTIPR